VHPTADTSCPASDHSTTDEVADLPTIERITGSLIASVASLIVEGLFEFRENSRMSASTRRVGGEALGALLEIQQASAGELDFVAMARESGKRALRERDTAISDSNINLLVNSALEVLSRIGRLRLN
jgi:hypothetical protein